MCIQDDSCYSDGSSSDEAEFTAGEESDSSSDEEMDESLEDDPQLPEMLDFVVPTGRDVVWGRKTYQAPEELQHLQTEQEVQSIQQSIQRQHAAKMPSPPRPAKLSARNRSKKQTMIKRRAMAKEARAYQKKYNASTVLDSHPKHTPSTPRRTQQLNTSYPTPRATPSRSQTARTRPVVLLTGEMEKSRQPSGLATPKRQGLDRAFEYSSGSESRQQKIKDSIQWDSE